MIKLMLYHGSNKYDITNMTVDVTWAGDEDTLPRNIAVNLINANNINTGDNLLNVSCGDMVIFYKDSEELFRGFIFSTSIDDQGKQSFTAYDELIYVVKNTDSIFVKNKSASDVIVSSFRKFGVNIGSIESTKYKIPKLVLQNKGLADICKECLDTTKSHTGKSYKIYSKKGKVYMVSREKTIKNTITADNIISGSKDTSIEDIATQVMVTKGSFEAGKEQVKFSSYTTKDNAAASKYGIIQHVEEIDNEKASYDTMKKKAKSLLSQLNKPEETVQVDIIGDTRCTTGNKIVVVNELANIMGTYYISSDSHSFSGGVHKMTLQLSKKLQ